MSVVWYVYKNEQQQGPIDRQQLDEQVKAGAIGPADLVWTEGMADWNRADQVEGLIPTVTLPPQKPDYASSPVGQQSQIADSAAPPGPNNASYQGNPKAAASFETPVAKSSTGMDQNIAGLLCYILGWITGIIFLLIENQSKFVRFHAMQSIVTFGGLTALQILLSIFNRLLWSILWRGAGSWALAGTLTGLLGVVSLIIWLATLGLAILLMIKAYQYETFKLPIAGKIAERQLQRYE